MKMTIKQSRLIKIISINIIIIIVLDFVFAKIFQQYTFYSNENQNTIVIPNPIYHHTFKSNYIEKKYEKRVGTYHVITNSLGFRDKEVRDINKASINKRIVFIGDSFTEGVLLDYEKTFVGLIEKKLERENIEVLNAAMASYSPIIYWRKIKYLIENRKIRFDHLIVFLDISDPDDEANKYTLTSNLNVVSRNKPIRKINTDSKTETLKYKTFIKENTLVIYFITNWISDKFFGTKSNEKINYYTLRNYSSGRASWTIDNKVFNEWGSAGIDLMKIYMDKLLLLLKNNNIDLTVAVYPWPNQIWYEDLNSRQVNLWKEWCDNNQVNFINYFPYFIEINRTDSEKIEKIKKYYLPYDVHFNSKGNSLIGKIFIERFQTNN